MAPSTVEPSSVHPREVGKGRCITQCGCYYFRPQTISPVSLEPSQADERITQKLKDALHLIDVRVLDHFVIGDQVVSLC